MLLATEAALVDGLLLLSYPLHPPRRPQQLRTAHFPTLRMPVLFVHGARDPFASLAELEAAIRVIPGPATLFPIEGAGHDLRSKKKEVGPRSDLLKEIRRAVLGG
jgi:predicted alpha/beta-hydrolase family hydrolase